MESCIRAAAFGCIAIGFAGSTDAAFVTPDSWGRGVGGTTYQHWDVFNQLAGATPDVASTNPNGVASVSELTGLAFVTGGGNIYSPSLSTSFEVTIPEADVPIPPHDLTAIVQIKTLGTELDQSSLMLNGQAPIDTAELSRIELGGFGGTAVESWFLFEIPYGVFGDGIPGVDLLTLTFQSLESSMSLDQLAIDTAIKPYGFYLEDSPLAASATPGDANLDGKVDVGDLGILAANFNNPQARWKDGDFSGDDLVDVGDLGILAANFGAYGAGTSVVVPEPGVGAMALFGVVMVSARRVRKSSE